MTKSIIVALDEHDKDSFNRIIDDLNSDLCMIKIGSVSFNALGHDAIYAAAEKGFDIFLDLKLHDIPNTVKKSILGLSILPISMLTVHASGGRKMLETSMDAVANTNIKIFGVTALTSLSDNDTNQIYKRTTQDQVACMLDLAEESGIHGVVSSPHELKLVTSRNSLLSITPGIRLQKTDDDQVRVMTPKEAIEKGANYIVIGRPITEAQNISKALLEIYNSIYDR
ncbi:orotidine-5'-phosphate decarboxylase [Gammaproteobacteria bacterium]|nr:orotidine-5'-phosphate decarboxylase [Gammaproteobacteria bacterium]